MNYEVNHVLMTADVVGGVWNYCVNLAQGLARHGVRTTLVTMGPEPSVRQREQADLVQGLSLVTSVFKLEWMEDPWAEVDAAGAWLLALADRIQPDVVHLNGFSHAAIPWKMPVVVAYHGDCVTWWEAVKQGPAPAHLEEYHRRVQTGLRASNLVIMPTSTMLETLRRIYGPIEHTLVVPNGLDSSEFVVGMKKNMVFTAGRYRDEAKNLRLLDRVAPVVDWPIYVAGDTGIDMVKTANLIALGHLDSNALKAWYSRAGIYAHPAKYEPCGQSVLEAACCGCALVLGDIPTLRELWGETAIYLNPDDPALWADALNMLADDHDLRLELGKLAREKAMTYSIRTMACNTLLAYQEVRQAAALDPHVLRGATLM